MSMMLNLVDRLLARGRHLRSIGRTHDALSLFQRLAAFGDLPEAVVEETQVHLAELHLRRRRYRLARRHLSAALQHRPDSARYHYLMARALHHDSQGEPQRALDHYRRSLELEPNQPECLCGYGHLALQLGQRDEGLACLHRALELDPDTPETLGRVVAGLRRANRADEARVVVRAALFRNPRDRRIGRLWDELQFQQLRKRQELAKLGERRDDADEPIVIRFPRDGEGVAVRREGKIVRQDGPAPRPAPHGALHRLPPQRHAQ